jgi:hypothetical protein
MTISHSYLKHTENYGRDAEKLMKRMLLLSDVAQLSKEIYFAAKQEDMKESLMESHAFSHPLMFSASNSAIVNEAGEEKDDKDEDEEDEDEDEAVDDDKSHGEDKDDAHKKLVVKNDDEKVDDNKVVEGDTSRKRSGSKTDLSIGAKSINSMKSLTDQYRLVQNDKNKLYDMIGEWEEPSAKNDITVRLLYCK